MNKNRIVGVAMAQAIKRLRQSGLPQDALEKAVLAVRGGKTEGPVELGPRAKAALFALVKQVGPVVATGTKALKLFTLDGYRSMAAVSSATAKKNKLWLLSRNGSGGKKVHRAKTAKPHWAQLPENRERMLAQRNHMNAARKHNIAKATQQEKQPA